MKISKKINCIFCKIIAILNIIAAVGLLPYFYLVIKFEYSIFSMIFLLAMSFVYLIFGIFCLLKTNNPIRRWNPLTINPNWTGILRISISDDPTQIFDLDKASDEDLLKINRNKRINKIIK